SIPSDEGAVGRVYRSWSPEVVEEEHVTLVLPLVHEDRIHGIFEIQGDERSPLSARDLDFIAPIAGQIAGMIERDNLYRYLEHQALTDRVTGLPNRQAFQQRLDRAIAESEGRPVSVLVIGVDGFKDINELYGHVIADDVLRQIGVELSARMPE